MNGEIVSIGVAIGEGCVGVARRWLNADRWLYREE